MPVGALSNIEFSPALPDAVQSVIDDKWNSQGAKIWIKIKGHHRFLGYAPKPAKMSVVRSEYFMDDDTTILVGFGYDNTNIDLNSIEDAQAVINQWRDDLEVVDTTGHNWVADKWAGQAGEPCARANSPKAGAFSTTSIRSYSSPAPIMPTAGAASASTAR